MFEKFFKKTKETPVVEEKISPEADKAVTEELVGGVSEQAALERKQEARKELNIEIAGTDAKISEEEEKAHKKTEELKKTGEKLYEQQKEEELKEAA